MLATSGGCLSLGVPQLEKDQVVNTDSTLSPIAESMERFVVGDWPGGVGSLGAAAGSVSPPSNTGGNSGGARSRLGLPDAENSPISYGRVLQRDQADLSAVATDYLRLTCDDSRAAEHLALECVALAREYRERGDRQRPWRYVGGYEDGWSCGPIAYAEGHNAVLVQASGVASDPLFLACKGKLLEVRPTRLDVQATIQLAKDDPAYARRMARRVDRFRHSGAREGYPFKVHVRDGKGDGDTLEIGTRGSEVYLRLYDKHREGFKKTHSKQMQPGQFEPGAWRYEAELKGSAALELYCRLSNAPGHSEGHRDAVLSEVRGLFMDHGLKLPVGEAASPAIRELRYRSDVERTRAWLRSAVRPSIEQLIADGYLGEVLSDLGLGELACVDLSQLLLTRPVESREG